MNELIRVKKGYPCPICGKSDWCGYSEDEKIAICMRIESDYPSKNGGWIHYLNGKDLLLDTLETEVIPYKEHPKATSETLHQVYTQLLSRLTLSLEHHKHLIEERKLSEDQITRHGYKTLPEKGRHEIAKHLVNMFSMETMATIPGFMLANHGSGHYPTLAGNSGLLIPIRDTKSQLIGFQIRIDNPEDPKDRYRWFSSSDRLNGTGSGTPSHIAYPNPLERRGNQIWITEGALKANISADILGETVIGVAGVSNWKPGNILDSLKELHANVIVIAYDSDSLLNPTVKLHGSSLADTCKQEGYNVQIASWPNSLGKGLDDLLLNGHKAQIEPWIESYINISEEEKYEPIPDIQWPTLSEKALYGLAGDVVRTIEPHTESDPAAILTQFLITYGSRAGRKPYFKVERDKHYGNLFGVIVGASSKARKGTSFGWIKDLFKDTDPTFESPPGGLVSGEGLIYHVRDCIEESVQDPKTGNLSKICKDEGVKDKRLLIHESEFSSVLKVLKREGNTLSEILRQAWDNGDLNTLAKNSKTKATNAHISLIGHVTNQELRKELDEVSYANGFGNRILWCLVRRSKYLPRGSQVPETELNNLKIRLRKAIEFAQLTTEMKRDESAEKVWEKLYKQLSEGKPGLSGAMTSRGEAQVVRLSCVYALLDLSSVIRLEHLMAALTVWNYCLDSCKFIFGNALGDSIADQIHDFLQERPEGMTRTEIYVMFGRNKTSKQILKALTMLLEYGLVKREIKKTKTKPIEVWINNENI
jgi:hypothetical protein